MALTDKVALKDRLSSLRGLKTLALAGVLAGSTTLAGCGGVDGVELQGGVFDALGLSSSSETKTSNVKVNARPGLVLPPDQNKLPAPQDSVQPQALAESWPVNPEDQKASQKAALAKRHADYCENALRNARITKDTGVVMGPQGNCQPGLFGGLLGVVEGQK